MNERIKELAARSNFGHMENGEVVYDHRLEKFAELIVKECAEMVRIQNEQFMENESHYGIVSTDILKHFGLEE